MLYLLNFRKHSNQIELDQFFDIIKPQKTVKQVITKSAFFQARKKVNFSAFVDLNQQLIDESYSYLSYKKWRGHRLLAIDGTSIRLPNEPDIINTFGVHKGRSNQANCTMGMASVYYDVLNKLVIDSSIQLGGTSEKKEAEKHLYFSQKNDLVIYDRGYNAFWFYAYHNQHQHHFCIRTKTKQMLAVKVFIASDKKEEIITIKPNKESIKTCQEKGIPITPLKLRLVRVNLENEVEVLITNLMNKKAYPASCFKKLYHLRWGIEENYKRLKQWLEIENFSGKSALSIKQDFYAKIVALNLTVLVVISAQKITTKKQGLKKREYQINFAQALSKMKHKVISLILLTSTEKVFNVLINELINYISKTVEAIREGRSFPRRLKNIKNDIHYAQYKSTL